MCGPSAAFETDEIEDTESEDVSEASEPVTVSAASARVFVGATENLRIHVGGRTIYLNVSDPEHPFVTGNNSLTPDMLLEIGLTELTAPAPAAPVPTLNDRLQAAEDATGFSLGDFVTYDKYNGYVQVIGFGCVNDFSQEGGEPKRVLIVDSGHGFSRVINPEDAKQANFPVDF
jgi:hypothetical protein